MKAEAFHRGDMDEMAAAIDRMIPVAWRLAHHGFASTVREESPTPEHPSAGPTSDGTASGSAGSGSTGSGSTPEKSRAAAPTLQPAKPESLWVAGVDNLDEVERIVTLALSHVLRPKMRAEVSGDDDVHRVLVDEIKIDLTRRAERKGRCLSVETVGATSEATNLHTDIGTAQRLKRGADAAEEVLDELDAVRRDIAERLWREEQDEGEIAASTARSVPFVRATERRVRIALQRRLTRSIGDERVKNASLDAFLSRSGEHPARRTRERIRREVLTRTFQTEPESFRRRASVAVGAAIVAASLFGLVLGDVLPGRTSTITLTPSVVLHCEGPCRPGVEAEVSVLAPRRARYVALAGSTPAAVRATSLSHSIPLPVGARTALKSIPGRATLPQGASVSVFAVFSRRQLSERQIRDVADKRVSPSGVWTASTSVALTTPE